MRRGVRVAVDVGTVRIGVATCDPDGMLATPVETVRRGRGDLDRIRQIVLEYEAVEVVVGLPRSLSGKEGPAARAVRDFTAVLAARLAPVAVRLVDERLSTVTAQRGMLTSGVNSRKGRSAVDQAAAVVILQSALDVERTAGIAPGQIVRAE